MLRQRYDNRCVYGLVCDTCGVQSPQRAAEGKDSSGGNGKTVACKECHSEDLNGVGDAAPWIAGRSPTYIALQLSAMRYGKPWTSAAPMQIVVENLRAETCRHRRLRRLPWIGPSKLPLTWQQPHRTHRHLRQTSKLIRAKTEFSGCKFRVHILNFSLSFGF